MAISPLTLSVGQNQTFQKQLTKLNTDIQFSHVAIGEGPIYRINPNGVQDIRVDGKFIDDLITVNNEPDPYVFQYKSTTGSINQQVLTPFSDEVTNNLRFSSPVVLKSGQIKGVVTGVPEANVIFFPTSASVGDNPIDTLVFKFSVEELYKQDTNNNSTTGPQNQRLDLRIIVHDRNETSNINNYIALVQHSFTETITFDTILEVPISIPSANQSDNGYRVSVLKGSDDTLDSEISSEVSFLGFNEISHEPFSYPRTASIGYALKATGLRSDAVLNYSSLVKGLIVKVPSNYDQPILTNGEVDWREVEVDDITSTGYELQSSPGIVSFDANPIVYKGIWEGTFKYDWTQNPAWIIYDLLTNTSYGYGIPESYIDKYNFYKASQIFDAVEPETGKFIGVETYADGSIRHKPRGQFTSILEDQIGLSSSKVIKERRIVCDLSVTDSIETYELINKIVASAKGYLEISNDKIGLVLDYPNSLPEQMFNEVNLTAIKYSGNRAEDYITAVEVSFNDGANNYNKDLIKIYDPDSDMLEERVASIDLIGCSRRSEAIRFAQYILASKKYVKRKVEFSTFVTTSDLTPGTIVSLSTQTVGSIYGYNGIIQDNSSASSATTNVKLQHISYPAISNTIFESNTQPLALRHYSQESGKSELYIISNTQVSYATTGNVQGALSGYDFIEVKALSKWDPLVNTFVGISTFDPFNTPKEKDLWALGEIDPNNYYSTNAAKLFRIDSISMPSGAETSISASEYVPKVYIDSENIINFEPIPIKTIANPLIKPAPPIFSISPVYTNTGAGNPILNFLFNVQSSSNIQIAQAFIPSSSFVPVLGAI